MSTRKFLFKVIVVGDGGVGKSTMIQRLITGRFIAQKITIGTDLAAYNLNINDKEIKLQIWDFAGEKRFRFFLPNYARGAKGCLLCYDITRYKSFQNLPEWLNIVRNVGNPPIVLVGGKCDLGEEKRTINYEGVNAFMNEHNLDFFFETSSKSGENNQKIFETLTYEILKRENIIDEVDSTIL